MDSGESLLGVLSEEYNSLSRKYFETKEEADRLEVKLGKGFVLQRGKLESKLKSLQDDIAVIRSEHSEIEKHLRSTFKRENPDSSQKDEDGYLASIVRSTVIDKKVDPAIEKKGGDFELAEAEAESIAEQDAKLEKESLNAKLDVEGSLTTPHAVEVSNYLEKNKDLTRNEANELAIALLASGVDFRLKEKGQFIDSVIA